MYPFVWCDAQALNQTVQDLNMHELLHRSMNVVQETT
jgi:hypothetical protein